MTNYQKGAAYELEFIHEWGEPRGYMGFRSAGSHTSVDVILIDITNNPLLNRPRVVLCQCKRYKKGKEPKPAKKFKDLKIAWDWIEKWWVTRKDRGETEIKVVE